MMIKRTLYTALGLALFVTAFSGYAIKSYFKPKDTSAFSIYLAKQEEIIASRYRVIGDDSQKPFGKREVLVNPLTASNLCHAIMPSVKRELYGIHKSKYQRSMYVVGDHPRNKAILSEACQDKVAAYVEKFFNKPRGIEITDSGFIKRHHENGSTLFPTHLLTKVGRIVTKDHSSSFAVFIDNEMYLATYQTQDEAQQALKAIESNFAKSYAVSKI